MRPHTLTKMMFDCRCGKAHPQVTRLAGVPVLECPAMPDDALRLHIGPTGNVSLMMGDREAQDSALARLTIQLTATLDVLREKLDAACARLDMLEAKLKRGAKE